MMSMLIVAAALVVLAVRRFSPLVRSLIVVVLLAWLLQHMSCRHDTPVHRQDCTPYPQCKQP
jgi:hypothetical protein